MIQATNRFVLPRHQVAWNFANDGKERNLIMRALVSKQRRSRRLSKIGVSEESADRTIGLVTQAIQEIASALDAASHAIMYYVPSKRAEPEEASRKLDRAKGHLALAQELFDEVDQTIEDLRRIPAASTTHDVKIDELH
ncbi:MAG TPA: hypothetical protein VEI98_14195 [Xanthobacteraceae bacterium]|nr:hypothetical protein [Xanthobacteraceae bacterium]